MQALRTFLSGVRAASRRNQPSLPGSHCRGGAGVWKVMGFLMMAPAMEDHEGSFTVYEVGSKVDLVYTP